MLRIQHSYAVSYLYTMWRKIVLKLYKKDIRMTNLQRIHKWIEFWMKVFCCFFYSTIDTAIVYASKYCKWHSVVFFIYHLNGICDLNRLSYTQILGQFTIQEMANKIFLSQEIPFYRTYSTSDFLHSFYDVEMYETHLWHSFILRRFYVLTYDKCFLNFSDRFLLWLLHQGIDIRIMFLLSKPFV